MARSAKDPRPVFGLARATGAWQHPRGLQWTKASERRPLMSVGKQAHLAQQRLHWQSQHLSPAADTRRYERQIKPLMNLGADQASSIGRCDSFIRTPRSTKYSDDKSSRRSVKNWAWSTSPSILLRTTPRRANGGSRPVVDFAIGVRQSSECDWDFPNSFATPPDVGTAREMTQARTQVQKVSRSHMVLQLGARCQRESRGRASFQSRWHD